MRSTAASWLTAPSSQPVLDYRGVNAVAESLFATLEKDLLRRRSFATRQDARSAVFDYIETFYNPIRLHSTLGYPSPVEYEKMMKQQRAA